MISALDRNHITQIQRCVEMEEWTETMECVEVWVCKSNGKRYCCDCGREITDKELVLQTGACQKSKNILRSDV